MVRRTYLEATTLGKLPRMWEEIDLGVLTFLALKPYVGSEGDEGSKRVAFGHVVDPGLVPTTWAFTGAHFASGRGSANEFHTKHHRG